MKRIFALLLGAALLFAGCGGSSSSSAPSGAASIQTAAADSASAAPDPTGEPTPVPTPTTAPVQPLTGEPWTGAITRPVAVMIDNSVYAQTQWGLADAQLVMEALTEGKNTNLCLWYSTVDGVPKVGPVSEGKDLFWQFAIPQNAIPVQKGANTYAANLLGYYGWPAVDALVAGVNSFDYDGTLPYGTADNYRWFTRGSSLRNSFAALGIAETGVLPQLLRFGKAEGGTAGAARVEVLYSADRSTVLQYDPATGLWGMLRSDGTPQTDANTGAQAAFTNLLLLKCAVQVKDDKFTREYDLTGGTGWYLTGDRWQPVTWQKGGVSQQLVVYGADGAELTVNPGRSYVGVYGVPGQQVTVTGADGAALQTDPCDGTVAYDQAG